MDKKEKPVTYLFVFPNVDGAREFYLRKGELGLTTEKECHELLVQMAKEGKMLRVQSTTKTTDEFIAAFRRQGFKLLDARKSKKKSWQDKLIGWLFK